MKKSLSIFLDLVRVLAASAVVVGHFTDHFRTGWIVTGLWGHNAVAVFFVLSGFVIGYVAQTREADARSFTIARLARLYSVMVPAVLLSGLVLVICRTIDPDFVRQTVDVQRNLLPLHGHPALRFFAQSVMTLTFTNCLQGHEATPAMNSAAWSLGYEAPYYLLFGLALFLKGRTRIWMLVITGAICGTEILRLFPVWLAGLALQRGLSVLPRKAPLLQGLICCLALIGGVAYYHSFERWSALPHGRLLDSLLHGSMRAGDAAGFYYWGALTVIAVYGVGALESHLSRVFRAMEKPVRWAAGHTFSIYLYHLPLMFVIEELTHSRIPPGIRRIGALLAIFAGCVLLSEITERQKLRWRRWITSLFDRLHIGTSHTALQRT